ncbi:MAG: threonine--tRNA ligase, partial [Planctomycetes bacterium]|nr:threonine--tRNA ligase [Planctomycetota bacterium]
MVQVVLPNGSEISVEQATAGDIAAQIGPRLAKAALAARVGDRVVGLDFELPDEGKVPLQILTKKDPEALNVMRHSAAHVMARAVMRLWDGVQLGFGPTIEAGFYYDFDLEHQITEDDFPAIEAEMRKIVDEDESFVRSVEPRTQALEICRQLKQDLKVEHIETGLSEEETLSFYRQGEFLDLCRGPHIPSAKAITAYKILSVAGAYWKGDATRQQMQRLYATAFFSQTELDLHLKRLKEAKARDHRVLGKQLELFAVSPLVGAGLILWLPKGAILRERLERFIQSELRKRGYWPVYTPNIGRVELFEISGHFPYYSDSQYAPIVMNEGERYLLKPMNCPHHVMIYKAKPRSYRELPLRLAEFGTVYRYEQSGEISGMTRVRGFTQDDAHIFCTEDQVEEEIRSCIEMTKFMLKTLGLTDYRIRLGFRDSQSDKYVGSDENWDRAEQSLRDVCAGLDIDAKEMPGEAAFYGPKADFIIHDCIGREWQLGTIQVDYNLPSAERFALEYAGADNQTHRPVMIHRAPLGSMERFTAILIEHFAGEFPLWLSPEQMRVVPVSEKSEAYGRQIERKLADAGFRVSGDYRSDKLGAKVRDGELEKTPYLFVVGPRDEANQTVSVRDTFAKKSADKDLGAMTIDAAIALFRQEVEEKTSRHAPDFETVT